MYEHLTYEVEDRTAQITLDRPDKLNALLTQTWDELAAALEEAGRDDDVRAVVLAGSGRAFSSGDDVTDLDFEERTDRELWEYTEHITDSIFAIERVPKPVIAKVDGIAVGGGCELAALCDVTIAAEEARFRQPEPLIGNVAGVAISRFPELIGLKRTRELLLTTRELSAQEAYEIGLVNEVVPEEELDDVVDERASEIADTAPMAAKMTKKQLNARLSDGTDGIVANSFLFGTEDQLEGVEAFFDGRDPDWQNS